MEIGYSQPFPDGCRTWHGGMGSGKELKFFSSQSCCDEPPALHLVLQLRIPVVSYKLVLPSIGGISLVVPCTPSTNNRTALTSTRCFLPGCPGHSFPRAQHRSSLCGPGIAVCHPGMHCPGDCARTGQCGAEGWPFGGISHQHHPAPAVTWTLPFWKFLWGFIPFSPAPGLEKPGSAAGRERLGREPLIDANHFPYTTRICRRGCSAISGYRVPFCFHSLEWCDLSF